MSCVVPAEFEPEDSSLPEQADLEGKELYLIRVPKGFDVSKLHGMKYTPPELCEIEEAKESDNGVTSIYKLCASTAPGPDITSLASVNGETTLGPRVNGFLCVNKSYDMSASTRNSRPEKLPPPVTMPSGLRQRFVPFGAGVPFKPSKRLKKKSKRKHRHVEDDSISFSPPHKKHKSKKHRNSSSADLSQTEVDSESILDLDSSVCDGSLVNGELEVSTKRKKHKKRKHKEV